jgi:hypothetical protein
MLRRSGCRVAFALLLLAAWPPTVARAQEQADSAASSGFGKVTFGGLLQVWYQENAPDVDRTFRIRRTELRLTGTVARRASWTVMIDPARALGLSRDSTIVNDSIVVPTADVNQSSRIFQDAYISINFGPSFSVDAGQRKVPLSLEGLQSAAELKTVERALMFSDRGRGGDLGDVRDIGVMAYGKVVPQVDYQVGVFNGLGENQNNVAAKDALAVAARVVVRPSVPGLQFGASGGVNGRPDAEVRRRRPFEPRDRLGVDGYLQHGRWTAQSELMVGRDDEQTRLGTYALAAYRITSTIEGVARVDFFDPDSSRDHDPRTAYDQLDFLLGANVYLPANRLKFQANAVASTFGDGGPDTRFTLLLNFQASW